MFTKMITQTIVVAFGLMLAITAFSQNTYDKINRSIVVDFRNGQLITTTYDETGNIISKIVSGANPLPVELQTFKAIKNSDGSISTQVMWETATEHNCSHFEVEYSIDAVSFTAIGKVEAAGNSNTKQSYQFIHPNPILDNNYYRLKIVDMDGTFEYSKIANVYFKGTQAVSVSPNPTSGLFSFVLNEAEQEDVKISIFDAVGRVLSENVLKMGNTSLELDISEYAKGFYFLKFQSSKEDTPIMLKIIKN